MVFNSSRNLQEKDKSYVSQIWTWQLLQSLDSDLMKLLIHKFKIISQIENELDRKNSDYETAVNNCKDVR